jgi:hypothetical protein
MASTISLVMTLVFLTTIICANPILQETSNIGTYSFIQFILAYYPYFIKKNKRIVSLHNRLHFEPIDEFS